MNKEDILQKSREENAGQLDEREMAAMGTASRVGLHVGAGVCVALVFVSELLLHTPEIALAAWLVYFTMQGSGNFSLFKTLKTRRYLVWGWIEIFVAIGMATSLVIKSVVS